MDLGGLDWHVLGTFAGAGLATLLAKTTGLSQRMAAMERRLETQSEVIAHQQEQISHLTDENRLQAQKMAEQDRIIRRQGRKIGDQARTIDALRTEAFQKDNAARALAKELDELRREISGGHTTLPTKR